MGALKLTDDKTKPIVANFHSPFLLVRHATREHEVDDGAVVVDPPFPEINYLH